MSSKNTLLGIGVTVLLIIVAVISVGLLTTRGVQTTNINVDPSKYLGNTWVVTSSYVNTSPSSIPRAKVEYYKSFSDPQQDQLIIIRIVFNSPSDAKAYMAYIESTNVNSVSDLYYNILGYTDQVALLQGNSIVEINYVGTVNQVPINALIGLAYAVI
jgi:hypothetical protein